MLITVTDRTDVSLYIATTALCHYIEERKSTMKFDCICYIRPTLKRSGTTALIVSLFNHLVSLGEAKALPSDADLDEIIEAIMDSLRQSKSLLVFERIEALEGSDAQDFRLFLGQIFTDTKDVHVMITSKKLIGLSPPVGVGEIIYELGPLTLRNTVKLFAFLCPRVHSPHERKELLEVLVPGVDTNGHAEAADERSYKINAILGGGIPAKTFSIAYQMSSEEFEELKRV